MAEQEIISDPLNVRKDNIWLFAQNKPTLIAEDLKKHGVPESITYTVLLARGVFKWLNVRRELIKLKNEWKTRITQLQDRLFETKGKQVGNRQYMRGYKQALEDCRAEVRALCHSERWAAPDFDRHAQKFLEDMENA